MKANITRAQLWIAALAVLIAPTAHATFNSSVLVTLPQRPLQTHFVFADGGARVIDVGTKEPSRIFDINDPTRFMLMTGGSEEGKLTRVERASTHEIFYIGDQAEAPDSTDLRRYMRGYSLANDSVDRTYSKNLYKGEEYEAPDFTLTLSQDQSTLYSAKASEPVISLLNLNTYEAGDDINVSGISAITEMREIRYQGAAALALFEHDYEGSSTLVFYDIKTKKTVFSLSASDLNLEGGGYPGSLRIAELSADATKAIFCEPARCLLINLPSKNIIAELTMDGGSDGDARFSPDGRFVFVSESNYGNPNFSVVNAADGSVVAAKVPAGFYPTNKSFLTLDKKFYVLAHGDSLLLISAVDGTLLEASPTLTTGARLDDMLYLNEDAGTIRFLTTNTLGVIEKWELSH